jgi:hypothetical protein
LCDKVCQSLTTGRWFSSSPPKDRWNGYGGVLVAVKSDYISELIDTENNTESIFIKISLHVYLDLESSTFVSYKVLPFCF